MYTNLTLVRGDDRTLDVAVKQSDGTTAQDLTGCALTFLAKYHPTDADGAAVFTKTIGSGITIVSLTGGTATITIAAANWSAYSGQEPLYWDLQMVDSGGLRTTLALGFINVVLDVTLA